MGCIPTGARTSESAARRRHAKLRSYSLAFSKPRISMLAVFSMEKLTLHAQSPAADSEVRAPPITLLAAFSVE